MMADSTLDLVSDSTLGEWRSDESMARHVSWKAGGRAARTFTPRDEAALAELLPRLSTNLPILLVGLGSNLLVRDGGWPGLVVFTHRALTGLAIVSATPSTTLLRVAAGVPLPHVARFAANQSLAGGEWMAGVPGTMGGALAMNAGCYGGETWNHVRSVRTIDRDGIIRERSPADFALGYRHVQPNTPREEWFLGADLAFGPGDREVSRRTIRDLLARRVASQPLAQPNAGSVFRNPPGDHAARLIEQCGLKGQRVGGAEVSRKHSNFIVNLGTATAADIDQLIDTVTTTVLARSGVRLQREVHIVGESR
jgi:UDP-N-acetylmuramate dehydrogenase